MNQPITAGFEYKGRNQRSKRKSRAIIYCRFAVILWVVFAAVRMLHDHQNPPAQVITLNGTAATTGIYFKENPEAPPVIHNRIGMKMSHAKPMPCNNGAKCFPIPPTWNSGHYPFVTPGPIDF